MRDNVLQRLSFGHRGADNAGTAVGLDRDDSIGLQTGAAAELAERVKRYAAGHVDDFLDVPVAMGHLSRFSAAVVAAVRRIPFGKTRSYGEIAALAGSPRAARAVGSVMAKNRTPLIVPCHRVLASAGAIGGYSALDGIQMKRRLLDLEAAAALAQPRAIGG
jgi:methylated-DNA-[protein]-cysteine S-methyltransferase